MKEETTIEKNIRLFKHTLYKIIKPIYLFSIDMKDMDEYTAETITWNVIYSTDFTIKVIEEYIKDCGDLLNQELKERLNNIIKALKLPITPKGNNK